MRLVYLFCIFLTIAVCSIARNDAAPTKEGNIPVNNSQVYTTAEPGKPVTSGNPTAVSSNASINISNVASTQVVTTTIASSDVKTTDAAKNNNSEITTSLPTIPTKPTTTTTTTKIPPTTSNKPSEQPITTISTTTSKQTTVSPTSVTTAIPISTKEAPPHKERQFDGLSFVGGIILIICLMAIGIFSYKFYRTLNERNYRTL